MNLPIATATILLATSLLAASPSVAAPVKIMAVGDSITEGYTPRPQNGTAPGTASYRKYFETLVSQSNCNYEMVGSKSKTYTGNGAPSAFNGLHEGWSGQKANQIRDGLDSNSNGTIDRWENSGIDSMMATHSPDVVLLHFGSNDMRVGETPASTVTETKDIISRILNANGNATVLVANVIPWYANSTIDSRIKTFRSQLTTAIIAMGNPKVILADVASNYTKAMMQTDLVHPNDSGESHIANAFFKSFNNANLCANNAGDFAAPVTHITIPGNAATADSSFNYTGYATDTGGSGFKKVRIAIQDRNSRQWYNFSDSTFGPIVKSGVEIGITNATLSNTTIPKTNWYINVALPAGDYTFYALAVDNAGNDAYTGKGLAVWPVNKNFKVSAVVADEVAPTTTITYPNRDDSILPAATITGTASDNGGSGLDYIRLLILDRSTGEFIAPDASRSNSWSWSMEHRINFTNAPNAAAWELETESLNLDAGSDFSVHALPVDLANNFDPTWPWTYTNFAVASDANTDSTPPTVNFNTPFSNKTLSGIATDTGGSGLAYVRLLLRDANTREFVAPDGTRSTAWSWTMEHRVTFSNAPESATWNLEISALGLTAGAGFSIHALAVDKANNFDPAWPWTFTNFTYNSVADTSPPTVSFKTPAVSFDTLTAPVVLTGNVQDTGGSGVNYLRLLLLDSSTGEFVAPDGTRSTSWSWEMEHWVTFNNAPSLAAWSLDTSSLGLKSGTSYSIHALAIDNANNADNTWPWTFTHFNVR